MAARYAVNTSKTLEIILWLASERPGIDVYHVVKAAFYADKQHLNRFGRPIAGDDYIADQYGPLGDVIYGLLKRDPLEILALGGNGELPFTIEGRFQVSPQRGPKPKWHVCVCPERRLFFRINSRPLWPPWHAITAKANPFLDHDSFVELTALHFFAESELRRARRIGEMPDRERTLLAWAAQSVDTLNDEQKELILNRYIDLM